MGKQADISSKVLGRGMLTSTLTVAYVCPKDRSADISSIRLVNTDTLDHVITVQPSVRSGSVPYIPSTFILEAECTCELIDDELGMQAKDFLQISADTSDKVSYWVNGRERAK